MTQDDRDFEEHLNFTIERLKEAVQNWKDLYLMQKEIAKEYKKLLEETNAL